MKRFGKKDFLLIGVLLLAALLSWLIFTLTSNGAGAYAVVTVDGNVYGRYPLKKEQEIAIQIDGVTTNVLRISDGKADMIEADCPDQLCVHQKSIARSNETIVCLPNQVVVTVEQADEGDYDSLAR